MPENCDGKYLRSGSPVAQVSNVLDAGPTTQVGIHHFSRREPEFLDEWVLLSEVLVARGDDYFKGAFGAPTMEVYRERGSIAKRVRSSGRSRCSAHRVLTLIKIAVKPVLMAVGASTKIRLLGRYVCRSSDGQDVFHRRTKLRKSPARRQLRLDFSSV